jgi:hypothetical protein
LEITKPSEQCKVKQSGTDGCKILKVKAKHEDRLVVLKKNTNNIKKQSQSGLTSPILMWLIKKQAGDTGK